MKKKLLTVIICTITSLWSNTSSGQAPNLGTVENFVLFSTDGAVTNSGISQLTGNVGTNNGSSTGFGNVNGVMHDADGISAQCATDLLIAYNQLNAAIPDFSHAPSLGNGQVLYAGVHTTSGSTTLNLDLLLDALGDSSAVFVFKIEGAFSTTADSKIKLINGAQACNVFWKIEGLVSIASGTTMRGTMIVNNAAINMSTGDTLEGRALSTTGAIKLNGVLAYIPAGCGKPLLTGPNPPVLGAAACYALFSSTGTVTNSGSTYITGDVGSNSGSTSGYNTLFVSGTIHLKPDGSTAQCAADLAIVYSHLNLLPYDIELLYPAQFGKGLVLTPHTYLLNAATVLTNTVYLNAEGNPNAVFVIQINGALSTGVYSTVSLINGAQAKNVYWKVEGAVSINNYSEFSGTIICNNGALSALNTGVVLNGRALTTAGDATTAAMNITATMLPSNCLTVGIPTAIEKEKNIITFFPNPFNKSTTITFNDISYVKKAELRMYDALGGEVIRTSLINKATTIYISDLAAGIYFYKLIANDNIIQSGKIISE